MAKDKNQKENKSARGGWRIGNWFARMFRGASKELAESDIFAVENLESPSKLATKAFFRRKLAVVALVVLISMFVLVFVGPFFFPMDVNYIDANQANIAPNMTMRKLPSGLKNNIASISGKSYFSIGVGGDNNIYLWGYPKNTLSRVDYSAIPEELKDGKTYMASAGNDHILAISTSGKLFGWGVNNRGQYGYFNGNEDDPVIQCPTDLIENGVADVSKIQQLVAGYQVSAMIYDGRVYAWGNKNACLNLADLVAGSENGTYKNVKKIVFTNYYAFLLMEDGTLECPGGMLRRETAVLSGGNKVPLMNYISGKKIVDVATTNGCLAVLLENGEVLVQGAARYGENAIAEVPAGEKLVSLDGGAVHFVGVTDKGHAYAWGSNDKGQLKGINGTACSAVYAGPYQTYLADETGSLVKSAGMKGYLFGTDNLGRDTFTRIIHGGKMTMTIGAIAVIISSVIAIIVGCLSGYFGGWVDILLMRVTEIFSAIPFLPFAMMLSYVLTSRPISETSRIMIIMVILGLLSWTGLARMIRAQVLAEREKEFVTAAKAMGVKERFIAFRHILPNIISVIIVSMTLDFAGCLLTESSLSYLGFGVQQPRPTWGNMLNGANNSIVIQNYWWQWLFPAIFLSIATISINILGDTLRDVLDPKSSQEK